MTATGYRIWVKNRAAEFHCPTDKTLLVGMEQQMKKALDVGCRGGGCGVCKIRVLSGEYERKRMSRAHISEQEEQDGLALACRIFPRSDLCIEAIPAAGISDSDRETDKKTSADQS